ncbi:hypothetical protein BSG8_20620 [Bacillus subtilis subsp. natto]|nr:hypothetical protein BSG8_20620 [Bacillus subtilis subsp. natto]
MDSNETKQPITDKLSAIGCLKGVLIPVSKTGVSPEIRTKVFLYNRLFVPFTSLFSFMLSQLMAPVLPENGG